MSLKYRGFTIVELLVIISVIGILLGVSVFSYGGWQRRAANSVVNSDTTLAITSLRSYRNFKGSYPPNLAGTGFAASPNVAIKLLTNAPTTGVYNTLTADQNAQLFLNTCNANLGGTPNNSCVFQGNGGGAKIHVKGTSGSNTIWNSPICKVAGPGCGSVMTLGCGTACDNAIQAMITQFEAQGGTFPITVSGNSSSLPEPTQTPNGAATKYCIEARSGVYTDIVYYSLSSSSAIISGTCPSDPDLHYYQ